ncbi:TonB-dependent receptor [Niabella sp.]|uniref:TonB-dependent receptor n=1 Tax=Niabella sp. TaxID=1962976 RepID=UPI0026080C66|nr:TonB-dependent receptor [Niabella sp.]
MYQYLLTALLLVTSVCYSQSKNITGTLKDSSTHHTIAGATIVRKPAGLSDISDAGGKFSFRVSGGSDTLHISALGFQPRAIPLSSIRNGQTIFLQPQAVQLADVVITSNTTNPYKAISETDIRLRGVSNSQEVLRIVPGLFIGQHQGGGKAEQIFLRGFDNDHGTDIRLSMDGLPVNMVSHAHGQGYADSHFIIPETIASTTYKKGMYDAEKGDLAVTGFVDFHTADHIDNLVKLEAGQYNTYRTLAIVNLLGPQQQQKDQTWYAAGEYRYSNSYFDHPQYFQRANFFTKYNRKLNGRNVLSFSASSMYSTWNASGQIPENAVNSGLIGFYGALDPKEGGITSRTNINAQLTTTLKNHDLIKNQVYYTYYDFDLHTNFTFFLEDSVNGDEIRQREKRNLVGYNGSYLHQGYWGNTRLTTDAGLNLRFDQTYNSALLHTMDRYTLLNPVKLGDIGETAAGIYANETVHFNNRFTLNAGLRFDQLYYRYNNKLAEDSAFNGAGIYRARNYTISPKLNFYYQAAPHLQFYLFTGKGFHSNDARVVVAQQGAETLPAAYGTDLGTVFKPAKNLLINAAAWYSYLQKEFVYGGDGGTVEFSGRTRRIGFDLSARYQPVQSIYMDADLNYANGRSLDDPAGQRYIPLAPAWSSTGGITGIFKNGINGSLRYRWLGNRPANADYSLTATGYFVNDLVLNYTRKKYETGLTINNLFNVKWKETQFETITRLKNEAPVDGIAFTPGTKFAVLLHFSYFF